MVFAALAAFISLAVIAAPGAAAAPLSIRVAGNHLVNGDGQTIRLLGVNHPSFEYACEIGYAYDDGHMDAADAAAVASWGADAVRVPLNEDCWLGLNGQPNTSELPLTMAVYRQEVENYVADLNAHGLYAILDLHWSAPGAKIANGQQPMPDDHSAAFWTSVATTFKSDPAVVFDVFNEPFSPADPRSGDDPAHEVSWSCWASGGCTVPYYENTETRTATTYTAVGMQALVNAIRATGATQPVLVGGLDYANDLTGWLENAPDDPLNQEAASFHNYQGKECDNVGCWNGEVAPVAANVPVVTGEFDQDVCGPSNFDNEYMTWADEHGVGYLAWGWWVLSPQEIAEAGCSAFYLLTDYGGTPAAPNGTNLHDHLLALRNGTPPPGPVGGPGSPVPAPPPAKCRLTQFRSTVLPGDAKVRFQLTADRSCKATIVGQTVKSFKLGGRKPLRVGLGSATVSLTAGKPATVTVKLPAKAQDLLQAKGSLRALYTVTLSGGGISSVTTPTATLKAPKPKKA